VLGEIRKAKTEAKRSLRTVVDLAVVSGPAELLAAVDAARADVVEAGAVAEFRTAAGDALAVAVTLAPPEA
jgi:valyl-tRNA synthetase